MPSRRVILGICVYGLFFGPQTLQIGSYRMCLDASKRHCMPVIKKKGFMCFSGFSTACGKRFNKEDLGSFGGCA